MTLLDTLPYFWHGLLISVSVFFGACALTIPVALSAGLLRFAAPAPLRIPATVFVEIFRGTSALVQLFWFYYVLPTFGVDLPAWVVGVLVLGLHGGAYGAEIVRGALQSVPKGQFEAGRALGLSRLQILATVQLPQSIPAMLPPAGNLGIELLKLTALMVAIDLHDLMFQARLLSDHAPGHKFTIYLVVMLLYFLVSMAFILPLRRMECREFRERWGTRLADLARRCFSWINPRWAAMALGCLVLAGLIAAPLLWYRGWLHAQHLGQTLWDWSFAWKILPTILEGLWVTCLATAGGFALALGLGLLWAGLQRVRSLAPWVRWGVEFIRSTPLLTQLMLVFYGALPLLGLQTPALLVGIVCLGLHISAYTMEVYRAGLDDIPAGQLDASRALGLRPLQTFNLVLLPQALPRCLPALGNYLLSMFKETPLLYYITVGEMLAAARSISSTHFRSIEAFTLVGAIFLILALLGSWLVRRLEKSMPVRHG